MKKNVDDYRECFSCRKTESENEKRYFESESLPEYLNIEAVGDGKYRLQYIGEGRTEEVAEIDLNGSIEVSEGDASFKTADYELFLECAGEALEDQNEIDNAYTLLEE